MIAHALAIALTCVALTATVCHAADWGGVVPGTSSKDDVRKLFGEPTRATNKTLDNYNVTDWLYEGPRAPGGIVRMVVEFGLLAGPGFQPDVVRTLRLEPKPGLFNRRSIISGWGLPYAAGREADTPEFYYEEGLLVLFDKAGWNVERLLFTLPQARQPQPAQPQPGQKD